MEECSDELEPNDSFEEASTIGYNETASGCIDTPVTDNDYFSFDALAGETVIAEVDVESMESELEGYFMELWNGTDELVYSNNDQTPGTNIAITHEVLESGTYYINLYSESGAGLYQLNLTDEGSGDFWSHQKRKIHHT